MHNHYDPTFVEKEVYQLWISQNAFKCDPKKEINFTMLLPPPNLTSSLHIGHCLTYAIQDTLTRWHRMKGNNPVWVPGTDAGGIGTEMVVKQFLHSFSTESRSIDNFKQELKCWTDKQLPVIESQAARMGASLSWANRYQTMDDIHSGFVRDKFIELFDKGLIYRKKSHVNWCPSLQTTLSDVETDVVQVKAGESSKLASGEKIKGMIHTIKYPIVGVDNEFIHVSTTRLETYPGDIAIAVHPKDPRYEKYIGKFAWHRLQSREIPIIGDAIAIDMNFGTGAVKVTPGHSREDYETALRHGLQSIQVFGDDGCLVGDSECFLAGATRSKAKQLLEQWFKQEGLWVGSAPHTICIPTCSKTGDVLELMLKENWYLKTSQFAESTLNLVRSGLIQILPKTEARVLERWLSNNRDWCLSRSIVNGHAIPAFKSISLNKWVAAETREDAKKKLGCLDDEADIEKDNDVLDTWFASSLIHYNLPTRIPTRPHDGYITDVLETGKDIIYFWVVRIIILGFALEQPLPFRHVILHNLIRDDQGRKMSKSLGNVINPIDLIDGRSQKDMIDDVDRNFLISNKEKQHAIKSIKTQFSTGIMPCGSDALRFTLILYTNQQSDIHFEIRQLIAKRKWCNKIWNGFKYVINRVHAHEQESSDVPDCCSEIRASLNTCVKKVNNGLADFAFAEACSAIYEFWQHQFCDKFIEQTKQYAAADGASTAAVNDTLCEVLTTFLKLLHPFMPFLSEYLWQIIRRDSRFNTESDLLMLATFPQ